MLPCHALLCDKAPLTRPPRGEWRAGTSAVLRFSTADFQAYVRAPVHVHLSGFALLIGSPAPCRLTPHGTATTCLAYVNQRVRRPSAFDVMKRHLGLVGYF